MRTALCEADDPALRTLIGHHRSHGADDYPSESQHNMDGATLRAEGVRLFVSWLDDTPVAMGGWKPWGHSGAELKSMHVLGAARGRGLASDLVEVIAADARAAGRRALYLETGSRDAHASARRLYERAGFTYCAPFAAYADDPNSVFMRRDL